jgi:GT2 family glycosyltransferase
VGSGEIPLVVVVVLNWNGWDDTLECLASLNELSYARYEVIVVDNGSTDPTP